MKYAYYPGCSALGTSQEYEVSIRAVCEVLGFALTDIEDWSCCGSTPAKAMDSVLSAALSARNLQLAAKTGADAVLTPCPSCLVSLKSARAKMQKPEFKAQVDELLDMPTPADPAALPDANYILQVLLEEVGLEEIAGRVTKPLAGLKVAPYYGCIMRSPESRHLDDPENPTALDRLMNAMGAEVVPFPLKVECCGGSFGVPRTDITASLSARILESAKAHGAEAVVVACPLCHMNLDLRQGQAERAAKNKIELPVFYFSQLMAYAYGLPEEFILLQKQAVDPAPVLQAVEKRRSDAQKQQTAVAAKPGQKIVQDKENEGAAQ